MSLNLVRYEVTGGIVIMAPEISKSLITEIWDNGIYNREYEIRKGDVIIDIGANIGIFSLLAASKGARVHAYEPNPDTFAILVDNIEKNGLGDLVFPHNCAISGSDGIVNLHVPESDKIYSLGSATISQVIVDDLCAKRELRVKSFEVKSVSLNTIMNELTKGNTNIDFIKIDCEGAEFEILDKLDVKFSKFISNIALETHEGYDEKQIVSLINKKGFIIDEYVKRSGHYKTGYCYAGNTGRRGKERRIPHNPVVILEMSGVCFVNDVLTINAEKSFILNETGSPLRFTWEIDETELPDKSDSIEFKFSHVGVQRVRCSAESGETVDVVDKKVVVLEKDYFKSDISHFLDDTGRKKTIHVSGKTVFCLPKEKFPQIWDFDAVIISIIALNDNIALYNPVVRSNGKTFELKTHYNEIEIDSVNTDTDVIVSLQIDGEADIEVNWWTKAVDDDRKNEMDCDDDYTLGAMSSEKSYTIYDWQNIRLLKKNIPGEWTVKAVKFGISAMAFDGEDNTPLDGQFKYNGETGVLDGWYKEIGIPAADILDDFEFSICFNAKRKVKIAWWAE